MQMYRRPERRAVTIPAGATESGPIHLGHYTALGLITPEELSATSLTLKVSDEHSGTYVPLRDSDGNVVSLVAAPSVGIGLSGAEADALAAYPWFKLVLPAPEAADRLFTIVVK